MVDYVLSGLVKRRAELAGEAATLKARIAQIATDLGHLDAVILQFDPDHDIAGIRLKRPRGPDAARPREMSRAIFALLREAAEPMTAAAMAELLVADRGINDPSTRHARMMAKRVVNTLRHQAAKGLVRRLGEPGQDALWKLVG